MNIIIARKQENHVIESEQPCVQPQAELQQRNGEMNETQRRQNAYLWSQYTHHRYVPSALLVAALPELAANDPIFAICEMTDDGEQLLLVRIKS